MLDGIMGFERSLEVPPEEGVPSEEEISDGVHSYAEYLRFFRAQEEAKAAEEEPVEEQVLEAVV
ncbi:unnamed protein product [marine sediment metagenome]|uniref:Uncharacterized protein n=1 Tax=marine sediment metagenome TaxID=412755 RepID=X1B627_9ZZZZ